MIPITNDNPETDSHLFYTDAAPLHGTLNLNQFNGTYTYTPAGNYNGDDSFKIRVEDAHDAFDSQTITVTITSVDDDPLAKDDTYKTYKNANYKTLDVVDNDKDADLKYGDTLTITRILTEPSPRNRPDQCYIQYLEIQARCELYRQRYVCL